MTTASTYEIRSGKSSDIAALSAIERSAGQLFRTVGLDSVADDEPMPSEVLTSYLEADNLWVATIVVVEEQGGMKEGEVVAFLAAFPIAITTTPAQPSTDEKRVLLHIAELSVHADHHRRGLGRRLIEHFEKMARSTPLQSSSRGYVVGLSLTTYRDVAFNGLFYAKQGFMEVKPPEIETVVGKRGKELWDEEQAKIAAPERRCWMVKWLDGR